MATVHNPSGYHTTTFGKPDMDYITVTTYNEAAFDALCFFVNKEGGRPDSFRGYKGYKSAGVRMLRGEQQGRPHFIVIGEGNTSKWVIETLVDDDLAQDGVGLWEYYNCTRIDVQVSALDQGVPFRKMTDAMRNPLMGWQRSGPKPKITLIEGQKSNKGRGNTLYVGSRKTKNGYMTRIYQKADAKGTPYLRFEVELKGKVAGKLFSSYAQKGSIVVAQCLNQILSTYPEEVLQDFLGGVQAAVGSTEGYQMRERREPSSEVRRALWFKYDVAPSLSRIRGVDTLDWLRVELLKLLFVLKNKRQRMIDYENLSTMAQVEADIREAQEEATTAIIMGEYKDKAIADGVLPEQGTLFSVEELESMLETVYYSHHEEYR